MSRGGASQTLVDFGSPPSYRHNTTLSDHGACGASSFHSSVHLTTFLPRHRPDLAIARFAARFSARFQSALPLPLSLSLSLTLPLQRRLFAVAPRPITSGANHPRRYASTAFFPSRPLFSPAPPPLSYSAFIRLSSASSFLPRAASLIFSPFFLLLAVISCSRSSLHRGNKCEAYVKAGEK